MKSAGLPPATCSQTRWFCSSRSAPPHAQDCGLSAAKFRAGHDQRWWASSYSPWTVTKYAVKWREPDGQTFVGSLALGPQALRLAGRRRGVEGTAVDRRLGYDELRGLSIGRLDGRSALAVQLLDGAYLVADAGLGAPIVQELVERLAALVPSENLRLSRNRSVLRPG
jgi:hypothetical protein